MWLWIYLCEGSSFTLKNPYDSRVFFINEESSKQIIGIKFIALHRAGDSDVQ